jgi:hypothetical protein
MGNYRIKFFCLSRNLLAYFKVQTDESGQWKDISNDLYTRSQAENIVNQIMEGERTYIRLPVNYKLVKLS